MSLYEFWVITMNSSDYLLRWTAIDFVFNFSLQFIQTLLLLGSAALVIKQFKQIKDDENEKQIKKKTEGLVKALEVLDTEVFDRVYKQIVNGKKIKLTDWSQLLDSINLVALLVEEKITDANLLLALRGKELYAIGSYIQKNELPKDIQSKRSTQYRPALEYLEMICKHAKKLGYLD